MRSVNGPMDAITRTEFEERMMEVVTKDYLTQALADTKTEILADTKAALASTKVEILDIVGTDLYKTKFDLMVHTRERLAETKVEILAVTKRSLDEAIAPLATKAEMEQGFAKLGHGQDAISKQLSELLKFTRNGLNEHEERLRDSGA